MTDIWLGQQLELEIEKVAHGGIFVARHESRVVFVSHTDIGERVRAEVFEDRGKAFCRAETIEVLRPSANRVRHFWKEAEQDGAGGSEFGHLRLQHQRALKAQVLSESLSRMAGIASSIPVQPLAGDDERAGVGYRTRVALHVSKSGVAGPHRERSHDVVRVRSLPLAVAEINELGLHLKNWQGVSRIEIASSASGGIQYRLDNRVRGDRQLIERAHGRTFRVSQGGFWQVHFQAAEALATNLLEMVSDFDPKAHNLDLFAGVGLFSATLASAFGKDIRISSVEASKSATEDARVNLIDLKAHRAVAARVENFLAEQIAGSENLAGATVVLDPPRAGAGAKVCEQLARLGPSRIVYVACDPVSLARDLKTLGSSGYQIQEIRALDLFPHTHHFETMVSLTR